MMHDVAITFSSPTSLSRTALLTLHSGISYSVFNALSQKKILELKYFILNFVLLD